MSETKKNHSRAPSQPSLTLEANQSVNYDGESAIEDPDKTQVSIALKRDNTGQTKITAKGSGEFAEQILQIAFDQGVKVRTDSDLIEILSNVDVESNIPIEALTAVATILNYVYNEQKQSNEESTLSHDDI